MRQFSERGSFFGGNVTPSQEDAGRQRLWQQLGGGAARVPAAEPTPHREVPARLCSTVWVPRWGSAPPWLPRTAPVLLLGCL